MCVTALPTQISLLRPKELIGNCSLVLLYSMTYVLETYIVTMHICCDIACFDSVYVLGAKPIPWIPIGSEILQCTGGS